MEEELTIGKRDIIKETEIEIIDLNKNINMNINKKKDTYYQCLITRVTNLKYGVNGIYYLFTDKSVLMQIFFALLLIIGGIIQKFTMLQWVLQLALITINIGSECCNTVIEKIANFVEPNFNKKIGIIKDVSAGMVMLIMLITISANVLIHFM